MLRLIEVFQQVGGVVRFQLGDGLGQNVLRQLAQKLVAHGAVEFRQDVIGKIIAQRADELDARVGLQQLDDIGEIGRRQAARELTGPQLIATGELFADGPRQLGGGLPIFAFILHAIVPPEGRRARPHASSAADSTARVVAPSLSPAFGRRFDAGCSIPADPIVSSRHGVEDPRFPPPCEPRALMPAGHIPSGAISVTSHTCRGLKATGTWRRLASRVMGGSLGELRECAPYVPSALPLHA